ncbi:uncharacterized protein LOC106655854 [Trichogramma pretiosum]|uniref:uncharacterized protein LOC106655854 n=1 Tax=Trichogramma pretiosum TaxID=7493 RepID=UPI0006C9BEDD|nr:uncharacterized protein LOC106655854 [Trichogramma pretiosum]
MNSSGIFNSAVRIKEEPCDEWPENDNKSIDQTPDTKNFLNLTFLQKNSTQMPQEYDDNHGNEPNDDMEIVFECEEMKPTINLMEAETQHIIKTETIKEVKKESFGGVGEVLNFDCEPGTQNKKRRITKKSNYEHKLKTHISTLLNDVTYNCDVCGKCFG